jgi:hypothetical protein
MEELMEIGTSERKMTEVRKRGKKVSKKESKCFLQGETDSMAVEAAENQGNMCMLGRHAMDTFGRRVG